VCVCVCVCVCARRLLEPANRGTGLFHFNNIQVDTELLVFRQNSA